MIKVLVADGQALFRESLSLLLNSQANIQVVGQASDGFQAARLAATLAPSVVLLEIDLPALDGLSAARRMKSESPESRVIVLAGRDRDHCVFAALKAGAAAFVPKDAGSSVLLQSIRTVAEGAYYLHPSALARVVDHFNHLHETGPQLAQPLVEPLSKREIEVLRCMAGGASNREIALLLFIAEGTVKNHVTNIIAKLGVRGRLQASLKARQIGIFAAPLSEACLSRPE